MSLCFFFCFFFVCYFFVVVAFFFSGISRCFQVHHVVKHSGRGSSGPPSFRSFSSLPDVTLAGRASSTTSKSSTIYARWKRWARDHDLPTFPASPYDFPLYLRHLADASSIDFAVHGIAGLPFGWGTIPFREPVGEGCSCWCTASFSPPYFQEGTYCRFSHDVTKFKPRN